MNCRIPLVNQIQPQLTKKKEKHLVLLHFYQLGKPISVFQGSIFHI